MAAADENQDTLLIGINTNKSNRSLQEDLDEAYANDYQFIVVPFIPPDKTHFTPHSDISLPSEDWTSRVIVKLSDESLLKDSDDGLQHLDRMLQHASYCSANGAYIKCPRKKSTFHFLARLISQKLSSSDFALSFHIEIPCCIGESCAEKIDSDEYFTDPWLAWNELRSLLPMSSRVNVALELTPDLPSEEEQKRWQGEPIYFVNVPSETFLHNNETGPYLGEAHVLFLSSLNKRRDLKLLYEPSDSGHSLKSISNYFTQKLSRQIFPKEPELEMMKDVYDQLRLPLQPLRDNLQSAIYETFEQDPTKYVFYNKAIYLAIKDKIAQQVASIAPDKVSTCGDLVDSLDGKTRKKIKLVILVVGAGRGPLVTEALRAAKKAKLPAKQVTIHIVEKNPHAISTLHAKIQTIWPQEFGDFAKLFLHHTDIRSFKPEEKADIIISELLGSFSDNELSPECLDGAYNAVKNDAICIPQSYTSHLHPIMSYRLYNSTRNTVDASKLSIDSIFQSHWVVKFRNFYSPCSTQPVFTFTHDKLSEKKFTENNSHNKAYIELHFTNDIDFVCHGFGGYFTAKLYDGIILSTRPEDHSEGLFSWFPIYFPVVTPFFVPAGEGVTVKLWRDTDGRSVWYEMCITKPIVSQIYNSAGRAHSISLLS